MNIQSYLSLSQIFQIVVTLSPIVTAGLGYLIHALIASLPEKQQARAKGIVETCVRATEQAYAGLSGPGKKAQAEATITAVLATMGIHLPAPILDMLLEYAVYEMNLIDQQNSAAGGSAGGSSPAAPIASAAPSALQAPNTSAPVAPALAAPVAAPVTASVVPQTVPQVDATATAALPTTINWATATPSITQPSLPAVPK